MGAEAVISRLTWNGFKLISKHRVPKPYRMPELDRWVRDRRTLHEAKVLHEAKKRGVRCPAIILIDRGRSEIYMTEIEGKELKKCLGELPANSIRDIASQLGEMIARMHKSGIAHGDLTTSNIILDREGRLYLVDFGLSSFTDEVEDIAVDIHLLDRSLESMHTGLREEFMRYFLKSYSEVAGREFTMNVMRKVKEIRMRGRYVEERRREVRDSYDQ